MRGKRGASFIGLVAGALLILGNVLLEPQAFWMIVASVTAVTCGATSWFLWRRTPFRALASGAEPPSAPRGMGAVEGRRRRDRCGRLSELPPHPARPGRGLRRLSVGAGAVADGSDAWSLVPSIGASVDAAPLWIGIRIELPGPAGSPTYVPVLIGVPVFE